MVPTGIDLWPMWRRMTIGLAIVQPTSAVDVVPVEAEINKSPK